MDDPLKEAGYYLRQWHSKWHDKEFRWKGEYFKSAPHHVSISGLSDAVGQARYCGQLLAQLIEQGIKSENIAVILLDAGVLHGVLNSIPETIREVNITSGFSLKHSALVLLIEEFFNLNANNSARYQSSRDKTDVFGKTDLLRLLNNPFVRMLANMDKDIGSRFLDNLIQEVRSVPRPSVSMSELFNNTPDPDLPLKVLLSEILITWQSTTVAVQWFRRLMNVMRQYFAGTLKKNQSGLQTTNPDPQLALEMEVLTELEKVMDQLELVISQFESPPELKVFIKLYRHLISQKSIPFSGEALKGLQIMGLLESRTLDFDYLIVLSCNDDIIPGSKQFSSFIPPDIRHGFGLPTYRQHDAVQAYHFYRLLQRSSFVWLLYGNQAGHFGGGEPSRFLRQLQLELPLQCEVNKVENQIVTLPFTNPGSGRMIDIRKTGIVLEQLEAKAHKGFSASSLNKYRDCPLRFYYSELAGIKEKSEFIDTIDAPTLGTAVHGALCELYAPLKKTRLTAPVISALLDKSQKAVSRAFESTVAGGMDLSTGKNLLLLKVAGLLVNRMILFDAAMAEEHAMEGTTRELWFLEESMESSVAIPYMNSSLPVRLKGTLDRVEKINGNYRILDYKTGKVAERNLKINDWNNLASNNEMNIAFQLLFYNHLLRSGVKGVTETTAGILPLKKLTAGNMILKIPAPGQQELSEGIDADASQIFDGILTNLLCEIFSLELPFSQTVDPLQCTHCPYINLCGR
jgi:hypothetical protein